MLSWVLSHLIVVDASVHSRGGGLIVAGYSIDRAWGRESVRVSDTSSISANVRDKI